MNELIKFNPMYSDHRFKAMIYNCTNKRDAIRAAKRVYRASLGRVLHDVNICRVWYDAEPCLSSGKLYHVLIWE